MERFTEKDLERLNHAQLCEIVLELDPSADTKTSKAELKNLIITLQNNSDVEVLENNPSEIENADEVENIAEVKNDRIANLISARRQSASTGINTKEGSIEQKIASRRATNGSASVKSISSAIADRRRGI